MGNAKSVQNHYDNAARTGVFTLKNSNIKEMPRSLTKLANSLRSIDLSGNKIREMPEFIGEFVSLKHLIFENNLLMSLPSEIGRLIKLETLTLSNNRLTSLPEDINRLSALRNVNLSSNQLKRFPMPLVGLKSLENLDLSNNKITAIPPGIKDLQVLELNLNKNQISTISDDIAGCKRLKVLRLEENCLELDAIPRSLLEESSVSLINVNGNIFKEKEFQEVPGYDKYLERFTATKKKMM